MSKKIDPFDQFIFRVLKSWIFYVGMFLLAAIALVIAKLPTWEDKNRTRINIMLERAVEFKSSDPVMAYEQWVKARDLVGDRNFKDPDLRKRFASTKEEMNSIYPSIKEILEEREAQRRLEESRLAEQKAEEARLKQRAEQAVEEMERLREKYRNLDGSGRDALKALKRLQAYTEVGVTKIKYAEALGEEWGNVKVFVESDEGRNKYRELSMLLVAAIDDYKEAADHWSGLGPQSDWSNAGEKIRKIEQLMNQ